MKYALTLLVAIAALAGAGPAKERHIYCMDHDNNRLVKIREDGTLLWDCPNGNGHDVQLLKNGNVLIVTGKVQEISPDKKVVWELGEPAVKFAESAQRVPNGNTVVSDLGRMAILEFNPKGDLVWQFDVPNSNNRPHPTMRQMRRLPNGNTLICASTLDEVWEVNKDKEVVWKHSVPFPYLATRLKNGNTLISSGAGYGSKAGYFLVEVSKQGKEVWKYGGEESPADQHLNWPSGFVRMDTGETYISEALSACIRVVSKDKKTLRTIRSEHVKHPCTLVVIDE